MNNIGSRIRYYRILNKYTQSELGELLGISHAAISHFETGRTLPSLFDIKRLSKIFKIPANRLIECITSEKNENNPRKSLSSRTGEDLTPLIKNEMFTMVSNLNSILNPDKDDIIRVSVSKIKKDDDSTENNFLLLYSSRIAELENDIKRQQSIIEKNYRQINSLQTKLNNIFRKNSLQN